MEFNDYEINSDTLILIPVENNKTKVIKRIMYGRCSFDLLRLKILS